METLPETVGLRERKKLRTRRTIADCAMRLFQERGFAATTIADIAAAADISPRTFFGYFPSKEDVLFEDGAVAFTTFTESLAEPRPPGVTAIDVLRDWIHSWFAEHRMDGERERLVHRLRKEAPSVAAYERQLMAQFEDAISAALAVDLGLPPEDVRARMVAAAAVASLRVFDVCFDESCTVADPVDAQIFDVLDDALTFLNAGLAALLTRQ